jgi:hypothetical protein
MQRREDVSRGDAKGRRDEEKTFHAETQRDAEKRRRFTQRRREEKTFHAETQRDAEKKKLSVMGFYRLKN